MKYRQATGSIDSLVFDTEVVESETVTLVRGVPESDEDGDNTVILSEITVPGRANDEDGEYVLYVVIYLDGTGDGPNSGTDQSAQMGAHYEGQLIFASSAGNRLTGTFTVNAPASQS